MCRASSSELSLSSPIRFCKRDSSAYKCKAFTAFGIGCGGGGRDECPAVAQPDRIRRSCACCMLDWKAMCGLAVRGESNNTHSLPQDAFAASHPRRSLRRHRAAQEHSRDISAHAADMAETRRATPRPSAMDSAPSLSPTRSSASTYSDTSRRTRPASPPTGRHPSRAGKPDSILALHGSSDAAAGGRCTNSRAGHDEEGGEV